MSKQEVPTWAYDAVGALMHLKFFPSQQRAVESLARLLTEVCKGGESQARRLVAELTRFDEYPGPGTIRETYHKLFPVPGSAYAEFGKSDYGDPGTPDPAIEAEIRAAIAEMEAKLRPTPKPVARPLPPLPGKPITEADIIRAKADRKMAAAHDGEDAC